MERARERHQVHPAVAASACRWPRKLSTCGFRQRPGIAFPLPASARLEHFQQGDRYSGRVSASAWPSPGSSWNCTENDRGAQPRTRQGRRSSSDSPPRRRLTVQPAGATDDPTVPFGGTLLISDPSPRLTRAAVLGSARRRGGPEGSGERDRRENHGQHGRVGGASPGATPKSIPQGTARQAAPSSPSPARPPPATPRAGARPADGPARRASAIGWRIHGTLSTSSATT